jgi:Lrp/AsnC family transcriptional regulator for asnA, asnC and gidA
MRNSSPIDDVDANLIKALQEDGRRSNVEIARELGVAEGTVRNRIDRLIRERVIHIGAWADPLKVGYQIYTVIEIQVVPSAIEQVAARLEPLPEIFFLGTCIGTFDIFAAACFSSSDHLQQFVTERIGRVPGIQRITTSTMMRIVKRTPPTPAALVRGTEAAAASGDGRTDGVRPRRRRRGARQARVR